ncbi:MAG: GldG family protein [Sphingomonadales bacterium]
MTRKGLSDAAILVLAAALFLALNVLSGTLFRSARMDLTEDGLFTLSDGTKSVLASLDEPVTLRLFFSGKLATSYIGIKNYGQRVRDLLTEYASLSDGRLRLEFIDPEPFTEAEDQAVAHGLQGAPTADGEVLYFGLVGANSVDDQQIVPFFPLERERFLEYDLTKLIHGLSNPSKTVVGLITSLPLQYGPGGIQAAMQGQAQPNIIYEQLGQQAEIRSLGPEFTAIDDEIDVLLIVNPGELGDRSLHAIDQFVLGGGRAMVFVDPHSEMGAQPMAPGMPPSGGARASDLAVLFKAWGVALGGNEIVADRQYAQRVTLAAGASRRQVADYVVWLSVPEQGLSRDDLVTGNLGGLNLGSAGYFSALEGATTRFEPLITSSSNAMLLKSEDIGPMPDPEGLLRDFRPTGEQYVIAARLSGAVDSAFPEGAPALDEAQDKEAGGDQANRTHRAHSDGPINVIVVADTDLFDDRFWAQVQNFLGQRIVMPIADNANFVINGIDNLAGSSELISLRSRGVSARSFTMVHDIRRRAEAQYLAEEETLQDKLRLAEERIADLQRDQPDDGSLLLTPEQEAEITSFRTEMLTTRKQLREVQRNLRRDIDALAATVKFVNIGLVPLSIMALAVLMAVLRRRRAGL